MPIRVTGTAQIEGGDHRAPAPHVDHVVVRFGDDGAWQRATGTDTSGTSDDKEVPSDYNGAVADGSHRVFAKARDAVGHWTTSAKLSFAVKNTVAHAPRAKRRREVAGQRPRTNGPGGTRTHV